MLKYLNFVVEQADLRFQLQRMDTIFVESITLHPCLNKQRQKASEAGVEITFIKADIRTLDLHEKFDFIFIPFNSIHHLYKNEDLFEVFNVVKNHLKDGGLFLLDCFNPNIQYIVEGEKEQQEIAAYTTDDGREVLIKQTMRYENTNSN